jgi:hypothetical protein
MDAGIYGQIVSKREFSQLPKRDVELAYSHFERRQVSDTEKIRLTRDLLHKVFGAFGSRKLLSPKDKSEEWILRKHLSTRERLGYYGKIYSRLIENESVVFDLGAGVNGFGYKFFNGKIKYVAVEAVGQWVKLMNYYFKKENLDALAVHLSLFELGKVKSLIKKEKGKKIIFLFKTLDSLEMLERDYSKKLLMGIVPLAEKVVVSFATESMVKRKKFGVKRSWAVDFIEENFVILDDFQIGSEKFIVFSKK